MEWLLSKDEIESELLQLERSGGNNLVQFDKAITFCQEVLEKYRLAVATQGFANDAEEIRFFKQEKHFIFGQLLKYTHQLAFELEHSAFGKNENIIQQKTSEANLFLSAHKDLVYYQELGQQHLDTQYFLRKNRKNQPRSGQYGFSFNPGFSTSHDVLVAQILGYKGFLRYLEKELIHMGQVGQIRSLSPKIAWTGSKVALTELGFALYYSGVIGHGNTSLRSIMEFLGQASGLDLGDYHHTSIRLRNRSNPTKFIDRLQESLKKWMEELDG